MWDTSRPDWEKRIVAGESLAPNLDLFMDEAEKALRIFKRLRIADVEGQPTMGEACEEWVFDFVRAIFGCYEPSTKSRLMADFFLLIAKKNGKSTIAAGIMLTALILNRRHWGEYLIIAPTREIAGNSFKAALGMVELDPALRRIFKPSAVNRTITNIKTHASLAVKAADADVVGGQKAIGVLVDELWLFGKKANAKNILSEATGSLASRPEGFVVYLSTQSDEPPAGVFKEKLAYHRAVRDGKIADSRAFQMIYEFPKKMQKDDSWRDPTNWYIPNPSLSASVSPTFLKSEYAKAAAGDLGSLRLFAAKHLNIQIGDSLRSDGWSGAEVWSDPTRIDATITINSLMKRCDVIVAGIDGGGRDDLLGFALLGREKGSRRWLLWVHGWCHESVLERRKSIATKLDEFCDAEELTIVDDQLEDVSQIMDIIRDISEAGLLGGVGVDPAGLGSMVDEFAKLDITNDNGRLIGVPQGMMLMSSIKATERKLTNGTMRHSGAAIAGWCVSNLKIEGTATGIRATKANAGDAKIDIAMAMFNAVYLMERDPVPYVKPDPSEFLREPLFA